jgi:Flp pilus assembly protein TadD
VISHQQKQAESLFYQGNLFLEAGALDDAGKCYEEAVRIAPDFAGGHVNLGYIADKQGHDEVAERSYRRSIELNPGYAETHLNLGALLARGKRFEEAETAYLQAIALRPLSPVGWSNLGVLCACMRREDDAEQCYRRAIALDSGYATARFNLSYLLLRQCRFEEGWKCLEARDWYAPLAARLSCPRWYGEPLAGKSILIGYEAGHGDMIQFCRYAEVLKQRGASSITMICHPALKTLFSSLRAVDTVYSFEEPVPTSGWDYWTPPLSIPYHLGTRLDNIPAKIPYLRAEPARTKKWAAFIPPGDFRVGLVWKGSAQFENDADRSLPSLQTLARLWSVPGVTFISLQKGAGEEEVMGLPLNFPLFHLGWRLNDFADTAAVIANLDLVISVDTAVAHLAGALGKPCWLLLPDYKTDWRWLKDREDSPWYPGNMRLFRQRKMGDWTAVVMDLCNALRQTAPVQLRPRQSRNFQHASSM